MRVFFAFFCSCASSALKYSGNTSFPLSSNSCKTSTSSCILAPIAQEAAPGVEGGEEAGFSVEGGGDTTGVEGVSREVGVEEVPVGARLCGEVADVGFKGVAGVGDFSSMGK